MTQFENSFSFHDSSLVGVVGGTTTMELKLEYVYSGNSRLNMTVYFTGIEKIIRDGLVVSDFGMETDDGEVFDLTMDVQTVNLLVIWHTHNPQSESMHKYVFWGKKIEINLHQEGKSEPD